MTPRYLYYITDDIDNVHFNLNDYRTNIHMLNAFSIKKLQKEEATQVLKTLEDRMYKLGGTIGYGYKDFPFTLRFTHARRMKHGWFQSRFLELKRQVDVLTLDNVMAEAPDFNSLLNDRNKDRVTLCIGNSEHTITFDDFIRSIEENKTYFVYKKVIEMT